MIQLNKIEESEGIDLNKTDNSRECKICYYNNFSNSFRSDSKICNECDWGIKQVHQDSIYFFIIVTLKMLDLNVNQILTMNVMVDVSFQY